MNYLFNWTGVLEALDPTTSLPRYEVSVMGYGTGYHECFWTRRAAKRFFDRAVANRAALWISMVDRFYREDLGKPYIGPHKILAQWKDEQREMPHYVVSAGGPPRCVCRPEVAKPTWDPKNRMKGGAA